VAREKEGKEGVKGKGRSTPIFFLVTMIVNEGAGDGLGRLFHNRFALWYDDHGRNFFPYRCVFFFFF
jgi:hypothetical protein